MSEKHFHCSLLPAPEVIVFDDPAKRKKVSTTSLRPVAAAAEKKPKVVGPVVNIEGAGFNLNKARHEVRQLGIKGLNSASKEDAMMNKLIQLGAKPVKRKYINYKELQEIRKTEKDEREDRNKCKKTAYHQHSGRSDSRFAVPGKQKRKNSRADGRVDGQIGRYVRGVQMINSKELRRVRSRIESNSRH